ncbi:MAG: ParA family protein [Clostridiales bacterium]|nr:ParA family protein [Clostridiales bacterium]
MRPPARITIVCGYYGSGKTTLSLNLARMLAPAPDGVPLALIDLDVVNPYFRSSDYRKELEPQGIRLIAPNFAGTMLDLPSLDPSITGALENPAGRVLIDAGGDDAGATALGCFAGIIGRQDYELLYVINRSRPFVSDPSDAAAVLRQIEKVSRLKAAGLVNNTHWGQGTTAALVRESLPFAAEVSQLTGLPVRYTTVAEALADQLAGLRGNPAVGELLPVGLPVQTPWQKG